MPVARLLEFIFGQTRSTRWFRDLGLVTGQGVHCPACPSCGRPDTCTPKSVSRARTLARLLSGRRAMTLWQGLVGGPVAPGRQQPVQAQGFVHGAVLLEVHLGLGGRPRLRNSPGWVSARP